MATPMMTDVIDIDGERTLPLYHREDVGDMVQFLQKDVFDIRKVGSHVLRAYVHSDKFRLSVSRHEIIDEPEEPYYLLNDIDMFYIIPDLDQDTSVDGVHKLLPMDDFHIEDEKAKGHVAVLVEYGEGSIVRLEIIDCEEGELIMTEDIDAMDVSFEVGVNRLIASKTGGSRDGGGESR